MAKPTKNYTIHPDQAPVAADPLLAYMKPSELKQQSETIRKEMEKAARDLDFPLAARLRDELVVIESMLT